MTAAACISAADYCVLLLVLLATLFFYWGREGLRAWKRVLVLEDGYMRGTRTAAN
jgi:hypothetical protein